MNVHARLHPEHSLMIDHPAVGTLTVRALACVFQATLDAAALLLGFAAVAIAVGQLPRPAIGQHREYAAFITTSGAFRTGLGTTRAP